MVGGVFRCKRCAFAAPVAFPEPGGRIPLELFRCPLCARRPSYARLVARCIGSTLLLALPMLGLAFLLACILANVLLEVRCGLDRSEARVVWTVGLGAVFLAVSIVRRWKAALGRAGRIELRCFWEWTLPGGARVVAVQDPGSGADAVWVDGVRVADHDGRYEVSLYSASEAPYRSSELRATVTFPAERTCWLMLGAKRIVPQRTSPDVV